MYRVRLVSVMTAQPFVLTERFAHTYMRFLPDPVRKVFIVGLKGAFSPTCAKLPDYRLSPTIIIYSSRVCR